MRYENLIGLTIVAAAIVAAGAMNRFQVSSSGSTAWRIDGWTGAVRVCRDYGSTHESLCENEAQFRDPKLRASD